MSEKSLAPPSIYMPKMSVENIRGLADYIARAVPTALEFADYVDQLHAKIRDLRTQVRSYRTENERLKLERDEARYQLARSHQSEKCTLDPQTCKEAECFACGVLMCPHAEPMHLHHDGCPACHGAALAKARGEEG